MERYDPLQHLDLLEPYQSQEATRSRKVLGNLGFIVITFFYFDLSIDSVSLLGMKIGEVETFRILVIVTLLLLYWLIMSAIYTYKDFQIDKERKKVLPEYVNSLRKAEEENNQAYVMNIPDPNHADRILFIESYEAQTQRVSKTQILVTIGRSLSQLTPFLLGITALLSLLIGYL